MTASPARARVERWVPGVRVIRTYERSWLSRDLIAGVVLVTLLVPQGMAYAELAGLPAITGLYTTVVCLIAYALVGPSPILVLGPDSSLGPMIAATILPLAAGDPEQAIALAGMLALLVGVVTVGAGALKLGFVADLLSNPVRTGYLAGLAVVILIGQLPKLFGFSTDADGLIGEVGAFLGGLDDDEPVGARDRPAQPGPHPRPQAAGAAGRPASWSPSSSRSGSRSCSTSPRAASTSSASCPRASPCRHSPLSRRRTSRCCSRRRSASRWSPWATRSRRPAASPARAGYEVDGDQELAGIGSANLAAGMFTGFPVSTSGSRTAVAFQSGAKTQLTGLVAAALVVGMLLFVPGLVQAMPQPVLAAVVIAASISLFDAAALRRLYRVQRTEFGLAVACALGVMFLGVLLGIVIAVALSAVYIFARVAAPYSTVLGKPAGVPGWHDIRHYPDSEQVPGLLIVRWSAPLFFANANQFRDRIRELVKAADAPPTWILVAAEPITDIDTTAATMLTDLDLELNAQGIHLAFAELPTSVRDAIVRFGLLETIDQGHLYASVTEGVEAFLREGQDEEGATRPPASRAPAPRRPPMTRGPGDASSGTRRPARGDSPGSG